MAYSWSYTFPSTGDLIVPGTYWTQITTAANYITNNHCQNCTNRANNTANNGHNTNTGCGNTVSNTNAGCANNSHNGNAGCGHTAANSNRGCGHTAANGNNSNTTSGNDSHRSNNSRTFSTGYNCRTVRCGGDSHIFNYMKSLPITWGR